MIHNSGLEPAKQVVSVIGIRGDLALSKMAVPLASVSTLLFGPLSGCQCMPIVDFLRSHFELGVLLVQIMVADVRSMLRWGLPSYFILIVVLSKFSPHYRPNSIGFAEIFAGAGEVSKALRAVPWFQFILFFWHVFLRDPWKIVGQPSVQQVLNLRVGSLLVVALCCNSFTMVHSG